MRQGTEDALCGIYAILNAISYATGNFNSLEREYTFSYLIDKLVEINSVSSNPVSVGWLLTTGIGINDLNKLLNKCIGEQGAQMLYDECDGNMRDTVRKRLKNISTKMYFRSRKIDKETILFDFEKFLAENIKGAIIFGWTNNKRNWSHWSVALRLTRNSIMLSDSGSRNRISKKGVVIASGVPDKNLSGDIISASEVIYIFPNST